MPPPVAFGSLGHERAYQGFYRLWSDGTIEIRHIRFKGTFGIVCQNKPPIDIDGCPDGEERVQDSGWFTLPDPPGGDGFACRTDINGDRDVNAEDLGLLLAQWGQEISFDPQPSYPCFGLDGLNGLKLNIAAR